VSVEGDPKVRRGFGVRKERRWRRFNGQEAPYAEVQGVQITTEKRQHGGVKGSE